MSKISAGKEIISYCGKCKLSLAHMIISMKDVNSIGKVQCKTCDATHAYKDPATKTKKVREFDSLFARSKSLLFILASGYSIASLINDKDTKINVEAGIITLILSYLINKSWTNN